SGRQGSPALHDRVTAPNGSQKHIPRPASGSSVPDRSTGAPSTNSEVQVRREARTDREQHRSSAPDDLQEPRRQVETRRTVDLGHSSNGPSWVDLAAIRVNKTESRFAASLNRLLQQNLLSAPLRIAEPTADNPPPGAPLSRPKIPSDLQREFRDRIEGYRRHQERVTRERAEYLTDILASL